MKIVTHSPAALLVKKLLPQKMGWKNFPKFRNLPLARCRHLLGEEANRRLFKAKTKFFRTKEGLVVAHGLREYTNWHRGILMVSDGKVPFTYAGTCSFTVAPDWVHISKASTAFGRKTGLGVFRFFLNDAIALARKNNVVIITISAENKDLANYYSKFGFEFEGLEGVLELPHSKH